MRRPIEDARLRGTRLWEMHAYERGTSMRRPIEDARLRGTRLWERHAYERHVYETAYRRCTSMRWPPIRYLK
jgi:hypothetical protein